MGREAVTASAVDDLLSDLEKTLLEEAFGGAETQTAETPHQGQLL